MYLLGQVSPTAGWTPQQIQASEAAAAVARSACQMRTIPASCSWIPFADFLPMCQPFSQAELEQITRCGTEYALRKLPPEVSAPMVVEAMRQAQALQDAGCRADPEGCRELHAYWEAPTLSKFFGPGLVATGKETVEKVGGAQALLWYVIAGLGLFVLVRG